VRRLRRTWIGAWLGVLAVALNALLPIHAAGDIAHAAYHLALAAHPEASGTAPGAHHHEHPAGTGHHHDGACPICAAAAAATPSATLPTPIALLAPTAIAQVSAPATAEPFRLGTALTPNAPRGPPKAV
jgi:hypothetical protein